MTRRRSATIRRMQDALRANDIAAMRQVIADGADINRKDRNGYPYLVMALMYRYYEIAKLLVESGADVNLAGRGNMTAIGRAVSSGNVELVRMLIDRGADVNSTVSPDEITPLHFACLSARMKHYTEEMRTSIVSMLIHAGADPNARDEWGRTPLHHTCRCDHPDTVRRLLEAGADPAVTADPEARNDCAGKTSLDVVIGLKEIDPAKEELMELFREYAPEAYFSAFCQSQAPGM